MTDRAASLVIGIGNRLREDDGAGYRMAETLALRPIRGVQVLSVQQLSVELASTLSEFHRVLFIDATPEPIRRTSWSAACVELIEPEDAPPSGFSHQLSPRVLLAITKVLYATVPQAWQLLIPGLHWNHGEAYSPLTAAAVAASLPLVMSWSAVDA